MQNSNSVSITGGSGGGGYIANGTWYGLVNGYSAYTDYSSIIAIVSELLAANGIGLTEAQKQIITRDLSQIHDVQAYVTGMTTGLRSLVAIGDDAKEAFKRGVDNGKLLGIELGRADVLDEVKRELRIQVEAEAYERGYQVGHARGKEEALQSVELE